MKRTFACSILIAVLILSLSVCLLAACNGSDAYEVIFKDGDTIISKVTVVAGEAIKDSDIPDGPEGHEGTFDGWYYNSQKIEAGYKPTGSLIATPKFVQSHHVSVASSADYTVNGLNENGYPEGATVVFSVIVNNAQKQISSVTASGVQITDLANGTYTFTMPASDVTITVTLEDINNTSKHTVNFSGTGFNVSGIDASGYAAGETVNFTISVTDPQKEVNTVTSSDVEIEAKGQGGYSFVMPAKSVNIFVALKVKGEVSGDSNITLFMYGPLYDTVRAVYAFYPEGVSGELVWESSDQSVASIMDGSVMSTPNPLQGAMPEAILSGRNSGTATIRCYLKSDPKIFGTIDVEVVDRNGGEAMPEDVYNKLTSSIKFTGTDQLLSFTNGNKKYDRHIDEEYSLTTIFEEFRDDTDIDIWQDDPEMALRPYNVTDGYHFESKGINGTGHEYDISCTYVSNGRYVCVESVDVNNNLIFDAVLNQYDEKVRWYEGSVYYNFFQGKDEFSSAEKWRTYDGGKTYHFTGSFLQAEYLNMSLFLMKDTAPDDMWITVENGTPTELHFVIDPSNYSHDKKYGREVSVAISEIGTAKIDHLDSDGDGKVFGHEAYHDKVEQARKKMAVLQNYKAVLEFDGAKYEFIMTEDTIDQVVYDGGKLQHNHMGSHKVDDNNYYDYTYDNGVIIGKRHNSVWNSTDVHRYPTFEFAPEIFEDLGNNVYQSRLGTGTFIKYCIFAPSSLSYYKFPENGTITVNDQGYITQLKTKVKYYDEEATDLTVTFSEFGTATLDGVLDFSNATEPPTPTSWDNDKSGVYENMQDWNFPTLPYMYPQNGWNKAVYGAYQSWTETNRSAYISTTNFDTEEACTKFIEDYIQLLIKDGWTATEEKEAETNYTIYSKGGAKLSIGRDYYYLGGSTKNAVRITVYYSGLTHPSD